jgi:hypothetical protein
MARVDNRKAASHFYQSEDDNSGETPSQSADRHGRERAMDVGRGGSILPADLAEA